MNYDKPFITRPQTDYRNLTQLYYSKFSVSFNIRFVVTQI